jgi:hypothetical protein
MVLLNIVIKSYILDVHGNPIGFLDAQELHALSYTFDINQLITAEKQ